MAAGDIGEICLRSPSSWRGYWRDPEATADAIRDGWVHTGDLGFIDEAGCLRLAGRAKEMFIRGGYNVYPLEVEAVLADAPGGGRGGGRPPPRPGHGRDRRRRRRAPPGPTAPPSLDDLRAFAAERLSAHKLPEALRLVDALPLTAMQKIDRRSLAADEAG